MVIDDNPFGCVGYTTKAGETIAPIIRNREHYTAKVNFIDGNVSLQSPTIAAFDANAAEALANAMGGEAVRNSPAETYYAQLRCHDPSDVSKPFGLLLLLPLAMLPPVATPTSPSPGRPSGSRPERTTPSGPPSRPGRMRCPPWREAGIPLLHFQPAHGHPLITPPAPAPGAGSQNPQAHLHSRESLTDPLHVPVRLVKPSSRVVFSSVIKVALLEDSGTSERKSLTVRIMCIKKRAERCASGQKATGPPRPHPMSSTSPAARGRQQSLPLWNSLITASIFRETSAL